MTASIPGYFNLQELTDAGLLASGGRIYTYATGTTTQKVAYTDIAGTVPHTYVSDGVGGLYIALNARGELPAPLYLAVGGYDIVLKTSLGATVWTRRADGINSPSENILSTLAGVNGSASVGFSQSSGITQTLQSKIRNGYYDVEDAGVIGAGNDAAVINLAVTNALTAGKVLRGQGSYSIAAAVVLSGDSDFRGATFTVTVPTLTAIVEIRNPGTTSGRPSYLVSKSLHLPIINASAFTGPSDWAGRGEGVRIHNCITCEIHIPQVYGFGVGVRLAATGNLAQTACSWNSIYYGKVSNNKINFIADPLDANGFVNENCHFGGRFCHESPVTATGITGCYHHYIGDTGAGANSQKFFGPSMEGDAVQYHILSKEGYNFWDGVRGEAYSLVNMQVLFNGALAIRNRVFALTTFAKPSVTESGGAKNNTVDWSQAYTRAMSSAAAAQIFSNDTNAPVIGAVEAAVSPHAATYTNLKSGLGNDGVFVKSDGDTVERLLIQSTGNMRFGPGNAGPDVQMSRTAAGVFGTTVGMIVSTAGFGYGNAVSASESIGKAVVKKIQAFDASGASIGYIAVYSSIS